MARSPEVFFNVTLTVDGGTVSDGGKMKVLSSLSLKNTEGSIYEKKGSFDEIEKTFYELAALKKTASRKDDRWNASNHAVQANFLQLYKDDCLPAEPVEVDSTVMRYIKEKHSQDLKRIMWDGDLMTHIIKGREAISFNSKKTALAQIAREKFITFYQKIATELQVKTFDCKPSRVRLLEAEFPELLITTIPNKPLVMVTGDHVSIARLEEFLKNDFKCLTKSPGHKAERASVKDLVSPATQESKEDKEETCPICMDSLTEKQTLHKCKHSFCKDCLKRAFDFKPACPICGVLYGELKGTQPKKGTMKVTYEDRSHLPGYEKYGTIVVDYYIPSGIQGEEHPSPGQRYEGASRTAYLPNSSQGRKVLSLLRRAFDQRLIFTIGHSSTTGRNNVVTWNDIHHKTSRSGGPSCYGYPDPDYLSRVQEELKVKGIF